MTAEIREVWPCYRIAREGLASLAELTEWGHLTIDDVDLACMALDAVEDAIIRARKKRS